jgi:hypothetical protein
MVVGLGDVREALDDVVFALDLSALVASVLLDTIHKSVFLNLPWTVV